MKQIKAQSAIEYLTTYGWAILVIVIVLSVLFEMGLFSPHISSECVFSNFSCFNTSFSTTGILTLTLIQSTDYPINMSAIGCNTKQDTLYMVPINPQNQLQIGQSITETIQCYQNGVKYSGKPKSTYKGYISINYTDLKTGFSYVVYGRLIQKVT